METLAYILSIAGFFAAIMPNLLKGKNMKLILFFLVCANLLYSFSYLAEGQGINGSAAGFLGAAIAGINFTFESKGNPVPKWLVGIYFFVFIAVQLLVAPISYLTAIIVGAGVAFLMGVLQPNGKLYRIWALLNIALWVLYDILTKSYSLLLVHSLQTVSVVVGMLLHDRKNVK
jgi:hypothetical protein